jgi:diguanylate cyclase (GGDEF)-like protein
MHQSDKRCDSCGQPLGLWATDKLTGLLNRWGWEEAADRLWTRTREQQAHLALLLIDIDHFKCINVTAGHLAGDAVLRAVADVLRTATAHRDLVLGRYGDHGGDEFLVLLPGNLDEAIAVAGEIRQEVTSTAVSAKTRAHKTTTITNITVSIGIAAGQPNHDLEQFTDLVLNAGTALHQAKRNGRDQIRVELAPDYRTSRQGPGKVDHEI